MASGFRIEIVQVKENLLEQLGSEIISHHLFQIDLHFRVTSSLNPETTLRTFDRSVIGCRDVFLSEENGTNILHSLVADSGLHQVFVDTVVIPYILSYAGITDAMPMNLGSQVIRIKVELLVEWDDDNEINELIEESLRSSVNFKPASRSSIEALKRIKWDDGKDRHLPLKKRRKLVEGSSSSSRKKCTICLDEFLEGDEVATTPCGHVYHEGCIVQWFETSHMCPLCRHPMPLD